MSFSEVSTKKLAASGLTVEYALERGVRPVTRAEDLPPEFAENKGLCPVPGMLFPWRDPRDPEQIVWQYRPDVPVEPEYKYVFPEGQHQPLGLVRGGSGDQMAIVEGTLQGLAFSRYGPKNVPVYAIPGCDGWSKNKNATESLVVVEGREVIVFLDADAGTNASVYDAGHELARYSKIYGATGAYFARAPGRGVNGIDDFLGSAPEDKRADLVARLLDNPETKPAPRKPAGKPKAKTVYGLATAEGLPDANDTGLGTRWADEHAAEFRYLIDDDTWLSCRDGRWDRTSSAVPSSSVMVHLAGVSNQYLAAAKTKDGDQREKLEETGRMLLSSAKRTSVRSAASDYAAIHVRRAELDQHPRKFCVANGVIDLETLEFSEHDPELLLTTGSDVEYVPDARCPRFDAFLAEAQPDEEVRGYLMRVFAMGMFGEVREHILPVLIGEGRNGKGTLIRVGHGVYGSHADVATADTILIRKFEKHEQEVARLSGKRLVTIEETTQGAVWNVGRINSWTGGDRLTGRWMGGNNFTFTPSHTLVIATNHRPSVGQGERAFWARYREIPFNVSFEGREDLSLEPHIMANELPGVLNRLIEAGRDYLAHGLQEPSAVTMATLDAKVDADSLARYCAEHIAVTHDHELDRIVNAELYESVIKWWSQNVRGEVPPTLRMFSKAMRSALGFPADMDNPRKARNGDKVQRTWTGIRWLNGGDPEGDIRPLPHDAASATDYRQHDLPNPSDLDQGVTVEDDLVADNQGPVADNVADNVDHETEEVAAQSSTVAVVAVVDSKVVSNPESSGTTQETPVDHGQESSSRICGKEKERIGNNGTCGNATPAPSGAVVFDLETDSARDLYTTSEPISYVRLVGTVAADSDLEPRIDLTVPQLVDWVKSSPRVIGHNIVHFDLPALSRVDPEIDILAMAREKRIFDTMIVDSVLFPIMNESRPGEVGRAMKYFGLDASAARHGVPGKTHDLKKYVKQNYGGDFNAIEWETDLELQDYLRGDVRATRGVYEILNRAHRHRALPEATREYVWREHRVHAIAAVMGINGFRVDQPLLTERFETGVARKAELTATLVDRYDIPTVKADGKPSKSPAATKEGKEALCAAFRSLGVDPDTDITRTAKGAISFGGDAMRELAEKFASRPNAEEIGALCSVVADSAGIRTVYGTALEHLHSDGKVHPQVATFQASGRWSVTKPGLTVFGKRGGKVIERAVFRAASGNVLMAIDLSQVDARAVAGHCQDRAYMDLFEPGRDSHMEVAEMVWGVRDAEHRHMAKAIGHGWNYGMGTRKLAVEAKVSEDVARQFDETMRKAFPRLVEWKDEVRAIAEGGGYLDNGFGRLMRPNPDRAYTQGPALMGQGTAREIMMDCILNIDNRLPSVVHMLRAQVHDEAVFELPESIAGDIKAFIESCFTGEFRGVPIIAEGGKFGRSWAECY